MARLGKRNVESRYDFLYPTPVAKKFISLYNQVLAPNDEQHTVVAAAHYSLASSQSISLSRCKMHVNSAISLLKKINSQERKDYWHSQIACAYAKRAELLEEKFDYAAAALDYQRAVDALQYPSNDYDKLLFAQSALSIADLIVNEQIEAKKLESLNLEYPLSYVTQALEQLENIVDVDDNALTTQAYAHQIAAIIMGVDYFENALEAYEAAVLLALKADASSVCTLLADIYACIGLLYEERLDKCPIKKAPLNLIENAMIYFGMSLLFSPHEEHLGFESSDKENNFMILESLFEMIYRVLDPFLTPISIKVTRDLIDALICAYLCGVEKTLPNSALTYHLNNAETLNTFAQHIYWLLEEYNRKVTIGNRSLYRNQLNLWEPVVTAANNLHWQDIYDQINKLLEKPKANFDNVHFLKNNLI